MRGTRLGSAMEQAEARGHAMETYISIAGNTTAKCVRDDCCARLIQHNGDVIGAALVRGCPFTYEQALRAEVIVDRKAVPA